MDFWAVGGSSAAAASWYWKDFGTDWLHFLYSKQKMGRTSTSVFLAMGDILAYIFIL